MALLTALPKISSGFVLSVLAAVASDVLCSIQTCLNELVASFEVLTITRQCHSIEIRELYSKDNTATANRSTRLRHASGSLKRVGGEVQ